MYARVPSESKLLANLQIRIPIFKSSILVTPHRSEATLFVNRMLIAAGISKASVYAANRVLC